MSIEVSFDRYYTIDELSVCPFCAGYINAKNVVDKEPIVCDKCQIKMCIGSYSYDKYRIANIVYSISKNTNPWRYSYIYKDSRGAILFVSQDTQSWTLPNMSITECLTYAQKCRILV